MKMHVIAVVGLGLVLATRPVGGQERSYSATKDVVWTAVHEAFTALQITASKEDKNKGEIQSDPAPPPASSLNRSTSFPILDLPSTIPVPGFPGLAPGVS